MNQAIWLKGSSNVRVPFFISGKHRQPNRPADPVNQRHQSHEQANSPTQEGLWMREHAKFNQAPAIERHQGNQQGDPKRDGHRVADVRRAKIESRFFLKILATGGA